MAIIFTALLFSAESHAQNTGGTHHMVLSHSTNSAPSQDKKAPNTDKMNKIWDHYTKLVEPAPKKAQESNGIKTIKPQSAQKQTPTSNSKKPSSPSGMAMIMQNYQKAKEARSSVKTLTFNNSSAEDTK